MAVSSSTFIDTSRACHALGPVLETVPSGSFRRVPVAPESIASVFGAGLATSVASAASLPLPIELGDTRVVITDSAGIARTVPLFMFPLNRSTYD